METAYLAGCRRLRLLVTKCVQPQDALIGRVNLVQTKSGPFQEFWIQGTLTPLPIQYIWLPSSRSCHNSALVFTLPYGFDNDRNNETCCCLFPQRPLVTHHTTKLTQLVNDLCKLWKAISLLNIPDEIIIQLPFICGSEEEKVNEIGCSSLSTLLSWHHHDIILWHHRDTLWYHFAMKLHISSYYIVFLFTTSSLVLSHLLVLPLLRRSKGCSHSSSSLFISGQSIELAQYTSYSSLVTRHHVTLAFSGPLEIVFLTVTNVLNSACGVRLTFPTIAAVVLVYWLLAWSIPPVGRARKRRGGADNLCRVSSVLTECGFSQGLDSLWHHHNESDPHNSIIVLSLPVAATGSWLVEGSILVPNI